MRPFEPTFVTTLGDLRRTLMQVSTTSDRLDVRWVETLERVRAFVATRVGDAELAADITQDVLVRSIASGALEHVENPTAWLYRSARNAVIDHYRTRHHNAPLDQTAQWPDPGPSDNRPNQATRDLAHCLQPLLETLPTAARDALIRVDLNGQTHHHAADALGISVSGMKSRVQRARRQLKALLERCCTVQIDGSGGIATYRPTTSTCGCGPTPCSSRP